VCIKTNKGFTKNAQRFAMKCNTKFILLSFFLLSPFIGIKQGWKEKVRGEQRKE
jgi:hypothetical protein